MRPRDVSQEYRFELQDIPGTSAAADAYGESRKAILRIRIVDFDFYSLDIFNQCESSNDVLIAIEAWKPVHPLLKILPVEWDYTIPFGILHAPEPSGPVQRFLKAIPFSEVSGGTAALYAAVFRDKKK